MKATAQRTQEGSYAHRVQVGHHELTVDEPRELGGADTGPGPQELLAASLAACIAITMEMYAQRKGWEIGNVGVTVEYDTPERGDATRFRIDLQLPSTLTEEQLERLQVVAGKCPVHRILEGQTEFEQRVSRI
jgi:putative redox protein